VDRAVAIAGCSKDTHQHFDAVARNILASDGNRIRIDVGRKHPLAQQLRCSNREDAGSRSDIERFVKSAASRQEFESHQASAGRWMFTCAKGCRSIHSDCDCAGWCGTAVMRAIDKEPADPQRRKSELIFGEPIPRQQLLFTNVEESPPGGGGSKSKARSEIRGQYRRLRVGFDPPLLRPGFKCR
jgi:hypothetical protein